MVNKASCLAMFGITFGLHNFGFKTSIAIYDNAFGILGMDFGKSLKY